MWLVPLLFSLSCVAALQSLTQSVTLGLDLPAVLSRVGRHCGTVRGRQILLGVCDDDSRSKAAKNLRRRRRHRFYRNGDDVSPAHQGQRQRLLLARTPSDLDSMAALVQEAQALIRQGDWPPIYGGDCVNGPLDAKYLSKTITSDDDEWLLADEVDEVTATTSTFSLWNIYQAEQVVRRILRVEEWLGDHPSFQRGYSLLHSKSYNGQPDLPAESSLHELNSILADAVIINRISSADPRSLLQVELNAAKFPILRLLQDRPEARMEQEREIQEEIAQAIQRQAHIVDEALDTIGRLDVTFAKGAFGMDNNVVRVSPDNSYRLENFRHPLLVESAAVPVELLLGGPDRSRALVISGPNGGGKSLALKSFGLAAVLLQMGIPIGSCTSNATTKASPCTLPFYDDVIVSFGDAQDVEANKSTFTAKLEQCSSMLQRVKESDPSKMILVLWDELLSGTDDSAGAAIGQAMLEQLLQHPNCHVVATTHSPQLKTFSFNDKSIECASVQLQPSSSRPTFRLEYGSIGQSVPYSAMTRTQPAFSEEFMSKVLTSLHSADSTNPSFPSTNASSSNNAPSSYVGALTISLEQQVERATAAASDTMAIRTAMVQMARTYETHLDRLEQRLQTVYKTMRDSPIIHEYELIGNTIEEVALVRRSMETEVEMLASRGLKRLAVDHVLRTGDSVVVIDETSPWHDRTGSVEVTPTNSVDAVVWVQIAGEWDSFGSAEDDHPDVRSSHRFNRSQLAVWDYDSIWDEAEAAAKPSMKKSKQTVHRLLASLETTPKVVSLHSSTGTGAPKGSKPLYRSSRERKAAKRKRKRR